MNKLNYLLNSMGFDNFQDLLGTFAPYFSKILTLSVYLGSIIGFIETYTGISFLLWVFLCLASAFDLMLGVYANVVFLKNPVETKKMFRGIFKAFVLMCIIFLTNIFKIGIEASNITPEFVQTSSIFIIATLHYSSVLLIGLYILLGIAENGAKIEIPFCVSLVKILKIRINKIEDNNENQEP